ncbi:TPA: hypothetical protein HA338_06700 [Methanosarcina acetivorans]|uniref:DUF4177 domain-containing protein n=1 Tax=Methanosarcina acetivorans TaxID=2214 RepID=A0A832SI17_9EURY|nr:hypothetical protein [Methanosarcina acetivorans]HIH93730.1 hypothetical protein [Methanosarcina acetivorans]
MKKFEYKCVPILKLGRGTAEDLNRYGSEGWELVYVWVFWHYLKREIGYFKKSGFIIFRKLPG